MHVCLYTLLFGVIKDLLLDLNDSGDKEQIDICIWNHVYLEAIYFM